MEGQAKQPDRLNIVAIVAIGAVGALVVYIGFVALQALFLADANRLYQERDAEGKGVALRTLQTRQMDELKGYKWVDQTKQTVTLPIERAMELVVGEVRRGNQANLVPSVGPQITPTVPAVFGRPPDNVQMPAPTPTPTETGATEGTGTEGATEEGAAPGEASATPAAAPAPAAPATPAPAAPAAAPATPATPAAAPAAPATPAAAPATPAVAPAHSGGNGTP